MKALCVLDGRNPTNTNPLGNPTVTPPWWPPLKRTWRTKS